MTSQAGENWRPFYQREELSWFDPVHIDGEYILRHARSEWVQKMLCRIGLRPAPTVSILEAGCGTALYSLSLGMLGYNVDAFDYNEGALLRARKLEAEARRFKVDLRVNLARGNLLDIQSASDSYDLVFNQAVLEYFTNESERNKAISEMVRVAKPRGHIAIIVQHTAHPFAQWWRRLGWQGYSDQPSVIPFMPRILSKEMRQAGMKNVFVDGIYPWKAFFFWPPWYKHAKWSHDVVYYLDQILRRFVPMPRFLRCALALQIVGIGQKL